MSFCLLSCVGTRKAVEDDYFLCDFAGHKTISVEDVEKTLEGSSEKNPVVETLLDRITDLSFPYKGFRLVEDKSGKVEIAEAVIKRKKGFRYIIYNKNKLQNIDLTKPNDVAATLGVLAHEIGHLTYGHGGSNYENELLADRYAGWVMKKLGVSRGNCIEALDRYIPQEEINGTSTHPPKRERLNAMTTGWDRADVDSRYKYSSCCDTSFYSVFEVEGIFFNKELNEGKPSFVDFTITTLDNEGKVVEEFGKQIRNHLKIKPIDGNQVVIFKGLGYAITNKRFSTMRFDICECGEPCDGINDERKCRTTFKTIKSISESLIIQYDDYGYMKLRFSK
ncbi:MAG: hypothetical protein R3A50_07060 [Saprospiraceae bacterium]